MKDYRFEYKGNLYVFPTEQEAKVAAFRLTGRIGAVPIWPHVHTTCCKPSPKGESLLATAIGTVIGLLFLWGFIGLGIADWFIRTIGALGVLLLVLAVSWLVLTVWSWWLKPPRLEEPDDLDPPNTGGVV